MPDLWSDLLSCLDLRLRPTSPATGGPQAGKQQTTRRSTMTVFEAPNQRIEHYRLFGGQLLGQFVMAAGRACPGKVVKSLHVLFANEGKSDTPVYYIAQRQQEGRTYAALTITARQKRDVIATATVSMHAPEPGRELQAPVAMPELPGPEFRRPIALMPWETRSTEDLDATQASPPDYELWMRTPEPEADVHAALVAYASDLSPIGTALRPVEGISQNDNPAAFTAATTSHSLWFHRALRTDEWLLLRHHSPLLAHGRCFARGDVLTEDGTLVASFAQEGLLRFRPS
ncbi:acyl-CoA thioesterase [Nocardia bovistercoris]|uniref:Thioesterase family protein n=1 Tax=Nocardia bovistercoris TaxID=2785916 RepID=A0A931N249_9NOCA|nr:acyl-CoA thioesterase domain-containing protein [Nocardia bovistercoris]MBH0776569.1 thioesterase family protein [Nocardia bovistercoris]